MSKSKAYPGKDAVVQKPPLESRPPASPGRPAARLARISIGLSAFIAAIFLTFSLSALAAEVPSAPGILDLNCLQALAATGEDDLAGVFTFIPAKDTTSAFADLLVRHDKAMSRFLKKDEKDLKAAGGISEWDHRVLDFVLSIYNSPLAASMPKISGATMKRVLILSQAPARTLEEIGRAQR